MMHLESIRRENWRQAAFVTTDPNRNCPLDEEWVASAAFSIVQSVYEPEWKSRLIMDDDIIVGFVFYGWWEKKSAPLLCRYMIDVDCQGKGYGKRALPIVVDEMMEEYQTDRILLTLERKNERAVRLYTGFGFVPTGETDEGEEIYVFEKQK
ncbi:MAG: GNAT family N-acetyltransferase [Oscillospiraceae bacterium]|nr:GNAT family N-acetyltransferase [Oscillospiraceae bacterium]